ncbi:MAG TPA: chemotaxis protein CheW [Stellaceae bacterium]|nr:chemotaxis protein CheW [Stellaceae bacterium]
MTLYLQVAVGDGLYLIDARQVVEVRAALGGEDDPGRRDGALPAVDLRQVFAAPAVAPGSSVLVAQAGGAAAALIVDRIDGLAEFDDAAFSPLPPIGPLGELIDALAMRLGVERPLLRLRGERALAAAGAFG